MRDQFDNYEKRIMERLDREAEELERRIGEDPQAAEARADAELDRRVYAGVDAFEKAVAGRKNAGAGDMPGEEKENAAGLEGLSDEDLEALRLGRELQRRRREEESKKETGGKTRKYAGMWKRIVAAAAVLVLVVGIGVNGVGGPNRVVEIVKQVVGDREISKINSSTDDVKLSKTEEELEAYQQIKDELGIDPVRIRGTSKEMKYKYCDIDSDMRTAQFLYEYADRNISFSIGNSYTKETWGADIEDKKIDEYMYLVENVNIAVIEYELPESKKRKYMAEFQYKGVFYRLIGTVSKEEFEKILQNLYFS